MTARQDHRPPDAAVARARSGAWLLWLLGGFLVGFGLLSIMSIGVFVLAAAVVVAGGALSLGEARRAVAVCRRLLNAFSNIEPASLTGKASAEYYDVMKLHDDICLEKDLFAWFSVHQTRFITRHTMELNNLKAAQQATVGDWLKEIIGFLSALESFHEYQIPLLEEAIVSLEKADKSQSSLKGDLSR